MSASPVWTTATASVRSFSVSRGRETELTEVDAGTATLVLNNRTRTFDPVQNPAIRPLNRWWIRSQFTGETQDVFKGYASSYDQQWTPPSDATTVVNCTDEFKILSLDRLPTMDPPRATYQALIESDHPVGYWTFDDNPETRLFSPNVDPSEGTGFGTETSTASPPPLPFSNEDTWWKPGYPIR